jgi:predicted small secreted protein
MSFRENAASVSKQYTKKQCQWLSRDEAINVVVNAFNNFMPIVGDLVSFKTFVYGLFNEKSETSLQFLANEYQL